MPGPEQPSSESPQQDWEEQLTPERALPKEYSSLIEHLLQTCTLVDEPQRTIAGYADEFLRLHGASLPRQTAEEIQDKKIQLLKYLDNQQS